MPETQEVIVIADEQHSEQLEKLSERLKASGAEITSTLDFLGQIVIQCEADKIPILKKLKGVAKVEISGQVELPPPDSEVQ